MIVLKRKPLLRRIAHSYRHFRSLKVSRYESFLGALHVSTSHWSPIIVGRVLMALAVLVFAAALFGCVPRRMTNEEIIEQVKLCRDNGLEPEVLLSGEDWATIRGIQCKPPRPQVKSADAT
jgi:hypothetical protein